MFELEYRKDIDLDFLEKVSGEELVELIKYLTVDFAGESYVCQELKDDMRFKATQDPHECWKLIAAELQTFAGDTRANAFRKLFCNGSGILYREIVEDILKELECSYDAAAEIQDLENLIIKSCYVLMYDEPAEGSLDAATIKKLANRVWKKWDYFQKKKPLHLLRDRMPWGDNIVFGPKYCVTIPSVLRIAGIRKPYFEIAEKYGFPKKLSLGIIGMHRSGKTSFLHLLQEGEFSEEIKPTAPLEEYQAFVAKILGINVEGGVDISGGDANVPHYPDFVKDKERILFFFNAASYMKNDDYRNQCQARFRFVCDKIYEDVAKKRTIKFIGTHLDELEGKEACDVRNWIYDSISQIKAPFSKMIVQEEKSLFVCNLKDSAVQNNYDDYIKLMKFAIGG